MYLITQTSSGRTFMATYAEIVEKYGRDAFRDLLLGKMHDVKAYPMEGH
jgi:hypothetical protein